MLVFVGLFGVDFDADEVDEEDVAVVDFIPVVVKAKVSFSIYKISIQFNKTK